jgi:hypothetical protein
MPSVAVATVADEGAADMICAALTEAEIPVELKRLYPEHPYAVSALATSFALLVPAEQRAQAEAVLARLSEELREEVIVQAAGGPEGDAVHAPNLERQTRRLPWAIALGFALPFPGVCFYARARRLGALFLGIFVTALAFFVVHSSWYVSSFGYPHFPRHLVGDARWFAVIAIGAKLADHVVGAILVATARRD